MKRRIYVNLPADDLERSKTFFSSLGFTFNPKFTDENAACMVIEDNIYAMLLKKDFFSTFTKKPISDAKTSTEVLVCLSCNSREEVDDLVRKALVSGGKAPQDPQDYGIMYGHGFEDIDGHLWELMYMENNTQAQE
jgi:predicted lactoylglutathione lyase